MATSDGGRWSLSTATDGPHNLLHVSGGGGYMYLGYGANTSDLCKAELESDWL